MCTEVTRFLDFSHESEIVTPSQIDGRRILQPRCNSVADFEGKQRLKKHNQHLPVAKPSLSSRSSPPGPPELKIKLSVPKGVIDTNGLNPRVENSLTPRLTPKSPSFPKKKTKKSGSIVTDIASQADSSSTLSLPTKTSSFIAEAPGSTVSLRRDEIVLKQSERKIKILHHERTMSKIDRKVVPVYFSVNGGMQDENKCNFLTSNSDPLYVSYHDQEWGVPVHDDRLLFEMLILSGAQVGLNWTSILKRRQDFRNAFAEFDAEVVANYSEKKIASISFEYGIDVNTVRSVVDNSIRILQVIKEFGSFDKYIWGFVNHKPIFTQYKSCQKIPLKTSKSESISKDMVKRGFRSVGPTVIHAFMQAVGLTNDHLLTCPRHHYCATVASSSPLVNTIQ